MIGSTVSHYEILEFLGGGGMGVVYKARDLKLDRLVALKFLSARRSGGEEERRFLREAKAASALDHPNICTVYEVGETADGRLFIAMALCPGETLAERIGHGPLPVGEAVDLARQIAAGLARAHGKGIVHRDVKPGNVIVSPDGEVKIVDFGVAKLSGVTRLTRAGAAVGTMAYMSPEQVRGEEVGPRTDVWSLGAVLYEMVAGRLPFPQADERELALAILHREPPPMASVRPGVPEELERIVARALAKLPAERYPSAEALRVELEELAVAGPEATVVEVPTPYLRATPRAASRDRSHPVYDERETLGLSGRSVAHYRVLEPLGGGGMGVVYRAEDSRLERTVALKFLPPELTRDLEAKQRFLQEARAASALEHPNVCTVHEVGETVDGHLYLVMPCYDGETLSKKVARGPLNLEDATDFALQIAQGLGKAHRHGIVHRDIKPANLIVTGDGVVKILDFGVAKLAGAAGITRIGSSVGTPAYMSPEQARGHGVDPRSDLWSLGVVLYEMIAGRRPFGGDHQQAVVYALLNEEPPPLAQQRSEVPPELERVVARLLAKDPARRYQSAAEVVADLKVLRNEPSTVTLATRVLPPPARPRRRLAAILAVAAGLVAVAAVVWLLRPPRPPRPELSSSSLTDQEGSESFPSLSPTGEFFVYVKEDEGDADIFWQRVGGGNPRNLTADSPLDDTQPAFSLDGQQIAFRSERDGGGIFVMGATGESVRRLANFGYHPAWSPDGTAIVVSTESVGGPGARRTTSQVWRVDVAGGARRQLTRHDAAQPSWSPGGHRIAYWGVDSRSARRVLWTIPAEGGEPERAIDDGHQNWNPVWSPDGAFLYYASDRGGSMNLWRAPIDERSGKVRDDPEPMTTPSPSSSLISLSQDGRRILYATNYSRSHLEQVPYDPAAGAVDGPRTQITSGSRAISFAAVSPDGRSIAFNAMAPQEDLFVVQTDGTGLRQLTDDPHKDRIPRWLPDGRRLCFYSNRSGKYEVWTVQPDGGGLEQVTETANALYTPIWSPDGRRLVCEVEFVGPALIDLGRPMPERRPQPLPPAGELGIFNATSWSPDGSLLAGVLQAPKRGIALYSFATGRYERLTDRGDIAVWLRDGRTLLFLDGGRLFALDTRTRTSRKLLEPPSNSLFLSVSPGADDRALYLVRASEEGDIGMLTLG